MRMRRNTWEDVEGEEYEGEEQKEYDKVVEDDEYEEEMKKE